VVPAALVYEAVFAGVKLAVKVSVPTASSPAGTLTTACPPLTKKGNEA
jgi:hypothetical protein